MNASALKALAFDINSTETEAEQLKHSLTKVVTEIEGTLDQTCESYLDSCVVTDGGE